MDARRILLTGATGFVGGHLLRALRREPVELRCASRHPQAAAQRAPELAWCKLDLADPDTIPAAVSGSDTAIYLVHSMGSTPDYARRDRLAAQHFARACADAGVRRVIYLGGVVPEGTPSAHLASRLETGRVLRANTRGVVELRAAMIVGAGSQSWRICRDLALRLPVMVLPRWMRTRSHPVDIADVVAAIVHAATRPDAPAHEIYDLPGPECLSAEEILRRIAHLRGIEPLTLHLPVLSPRLSGVWLKLVSGADYAVARELIEGLTQDLLPSCPLYWKYMQGRSLVPFDEAARRALAAESSSPAPARLVESFASRVARRYR